MHTDRVSLRCSSAASQKIVYSYNMLNDALMENSVLVHAYLSSTPCHTCGLRMYCIRDYCYGQGFHKDLGFWSTPGMIWCQSSINANNFLVKAEERCSFGSKFKELSK